MERRIRNVLHLIEIFFVNPAQALDRVRVLLEIYLNRWLFNEKPDIGLTLDEFLKSFPGEFITYIEEGERELFKVRSYFVSVIKEFPSLPFPTYYNVDRSIGILCYAFVRWLRPEIVLETGVGYGISSALILRALQKNAWGQLISIDLPPLGDYQGNFVGLAVPSSLREKWILKFGNTRKLLPRVVNTLPKIDMFLSDSANVYTLQKFEFEQVSTKMSYGGVCLFNNITLKMLRYLSQIRNTEFYIIKQEEKRECFTGILKWTKEE